MSRVLLIDQNALFRLGLSELVKAAQPAFTTLEAETSGLRAAALLREFGDVSLIMLAHQGLGLWWFCRPVSIAVRVSRHTHIVLSAGADPELVSRAVAFGAAGYISKAASCDAISQTLKKALWGEVWAPVPIIAGTDQANPIASLSPALLRVLAGLKRGLRNKQIAFELGLAERTVKAYTHALYRKLGVNSRTQALILLQDVMPDSRIQQSQQVQAG